MLEQVCAHIHNYFEEARYDGRFVIEGGALEWPTLAAGQYYRIAGSRANDGVHRHPAEDLADEVFEGTIWTMKPPGSFLRLVAEIAAWQARFGEAVASPYRAENVIGVYSYQFREGGALGWQGLFRERLNEWRRLA